MLHNFSEIDLLPETVIDTDDIFIAIPLDQISNYFCYPGILLLP